MIPVFIGIGTFVLIIVALFLILVVLAQRAKSDSGMAAMGGGMMESAFGPDTSNVLSRMTIRATIVFFVLSFLLYLGYIHLRSHPSGSREALPNIPAPAASASAPAAAPAVSVPITAAPDAAKTTTQSGTATQSP
jgi:preprotein translocase subunit SecG